MFQGIPQHLHRHSYQFDKKTKKRIEGQRAQILELLLEMAQDADAITVSNHEIATQLGLTAHTVEMRLKDLRDRGLLTTKMGYSKGTQSPTRRLYPKASR